MKLPSPITTGVVLRACVGEIKGRREPRTNVSYVDGAHAREDGAQMAVGDEDIDATVLHDGPGKRILGNRMYALLFMRWDLDGVLLNGTVSECENHRIQGLITSSQINP